MSKFYLSSSRYLTVLLMLVTTMAWSQGRTVTGKVTSADDGSGIPGVNVVEKGTSNGTATDVDGNFSINVPDDATLVFSFVGYATQELVVGSQTSINVTLVSDVTSLSEVVVVGYGSQEKKEITGAVAALGTEDFNRGNINDPTQLLQGKVAGLSVYNKGGDPNTNSTIRLRGISTVGANNSPLVVIDGVLGASLDNIDPNDIESINVLKDGSAAAIYGSRGSSGVILVTTKRGSTKGIGIDYNGYVSSASIFRSVPVMSPGEYVANGGNDLGSQTDWMDLVTQTAVSNVHNIAVSGGGDNTSFRLATNFRNINGILKGSGFDQINGRANLSHSALDNRLKIDLNMSLTNRNFNRSFNEALRYASLYNPTAPIYFPDGSYYQAILFDNFNPLAIIEQNVNEGRRRTINFGGKVDYSVIKNLTLTLNYGQQFQNETTGEYYGINSLFRGYNRHGLARRFSQDTEFSLVEAYGTYSSSFGSLALDATAGYSYQMDNLQNMFVELGNFPSDALGYHALETSGDRLSGLPNRTNINSEATPNSKIIAFFGRVNLTFDEAIFLNASVRREGSTKLGEENQWGIFPAVGLGVDINKYLQLERASLLKIRLGYGVTGSLPPASGYAQAEYLYEFNQGGNVRKTREPNPDLKWEEKAELNGGIDFGLLSGRLGGSIDVYRRTISDFILLYTPPAGEGAPNPYYRNIGSLKTSGFEINLSYKAKFGELNWTPGIVMSSYKSTLTEFLADEQMIAELGAPGQNGTYMVRVGVNEPIGQIWGPVFDHVSTGGSDGANQEQDPADENYDPTKGVAAGGPVFKDLNGDGRIDANPANALISGDMKNLGSGLPTMELGWTNSFTYKNWDLNIFLRGAFGHSLVNTFRAFYEPIDPGAINSYNRIVTDKSVDGLTVAKYSSLYVEKADFVKLDNISLGYNFNMQGKAVKNIRLYVTGQNLFQITSYTGIDPEPVLQSSPPLDNGGFFDPNSVGARPQNMILSPGIDRRNNYFTAKTFTFGVNIGL